MDRSWREYLNLFHVGRLLLVLAVCVLCFHGVTVVYGEESVSGKCGKDATWTIEGTVLTIRGNGPMWDIEERDTREEEEQLRPLMGLWTAEQNSRIKKVIVEKGITRIGDRVFSFAEKLKTVSLADEVERIGVASFAQCTSLTKINSPKQLKYIADVAFYNCSALKEFRVPRKVRFVGDMSFGACSSLKKIVFSGKDVEMTQECFYNCTSLTEIHFSASNQTAIEASPGYATKWGAPSSCSIIFDDDSSGEGESVTLTVGSTTMYGMTLKGFCVGDDEVAAFGTISPTSVCSASITCGRMSPPTRTNMMSSPMFSSPEFSHTRIYVMPSIFFAASIAASTFSRS